MIKKENYLMDKGITLVEVLMAVAVFTIGILAILGMFSLGNKIARTSQSQTIASNLAQDKMEEIISSSYDYDEVSVGTIEPKHQLDSPFEKYSRQTIVTCVDPDLQLVDCGYNPDGNPYPLKKIEVTVFWKNIETKLDTLISKH